MICFVYGVIELPCKVVTWKIDASILRWTTITLARLFSWTSLGIRCVNPRGLDAGQRNPGGYSQMRRIQDPRYGTVGHGLSIRFHLNFPVDILKCHISSLLIIRSIRGYWKPLFRIEQTQTVILTFFESNFYLFSYIQYCFYFWYILVYAEKDLCSHFKFRRHCRSLKYDRAINGRFIYRA